MRTKKQHPDLLAALTKRELEILALVHDGLSNAEIAARLVLTRDTVKWYLQQIYSKLGVGSRTQAVARCRNLKLFPFQTASASGLQEQVQHNLPTQLLPFVGREEEVAIIQRLLTSANLRLISITGTGGIGKTHLAIELGRRLLGSFPDGVFFVSFEAIISIDQIFARIADAVGYQPTIPARIEQALLGYLRDREMLLLLDNFEHLLDGAALISDLLDHAPQVRVVVTSREKLNVRAETVVAIEGLPFPTDAAVERIPEYPSVRFFCECARRNLQSFDPKREAEWRAIGRICTLVEGMPLALLLAASWIDTLSVEDIVQEVGHALDFLTSDIRDVPLRQRSIRAVFSSIYGRLTNAEQTAFAWFSVFQGRCSREAAQTVTGASLNTLARLVSTSLIRHIASSGQYEVHELLRQYGQERLEEAGQLAAARDAHAEYYADFLLRQVDALKSDGQPTALDAIVANFDNIRLAWSWMVKRENVAAMARAAEGLRLFSEVLTYFIDQVMDMYRAALGLIESLSDHTSTESWTRGIMNLYEGLGNMLQLMGAYDEAHQAFDQALQRVPLKSVIDQARLYRKQGSTWDSQRVAEEALRLQTLSENTLGTPPVPDDREWWQEWIAIQMGQITALYFSGQLKPKLQRIARTRVVVEKNGRPDQQVDFYGSIGMAYLQRDRFLPSDETLVIHQRRLAAAVDFGDPNKIGSGHFNLGFCRLWRDELDLAEEQLQAALALGKQLGNLLLETMCQTYLSVVTRKHGFVDETERRALEALDAANAVAIPFYIAIVQSNLSWVAWRRQEFAEAKNQAQRALDVLQRVDGLAFLWLACWPLFGAAIKEGRLVEAMTQAKLMLEPIRHPLPDAISAALRDAIQAEDEGDEVMMHTHLLRAFQLAQTAGHL